jgi:thioester reductase-like protein
VVAVAVASPPARLAEVLGTMRAGAAALLLDAADPQPWRDRQLASMGASAVLTDALYRDADGVACWADPAPDHDAPDHDAGPACADPSAPALLSPVPRRGGFDAWILTGGDLAVIARGLATRCELGADDRVLIGPGAPAFAVVGALAAGLAGAEVVTEDPTVILSPHGGSDGPADGGYPAAESRVGGSAVCVYAVHCPPESGIPYAAGLAGKSARGLPGVVSFVRDDTGALALPGATGELMLSGAAPVLRSGQVGTGFLARVVPGQVPEASARADGLPLVAGRVVDSCWASDHLAALPELRDVAVIGGPDGAVAFVTPPDVSVGPIGDRLRRELPAHLVPARIIALPRLARARDGSTDTVALAALAARAEPGAASTPRTHVERALLDCFTHSLDRGDLGIYDDFFASGGTSLAAARLTSALSDAVGVPVPLKMLFQHPTVAELAAALDGDRVRTGRGTALQDALSDQVLPPDIRPAGPPRDRRETVFLTGATGFVGSQLLAQLLSAGIRRVWCLVRGEDEQACRDRLLATLARYSLEVDADRIGVLRGDLTKPLLDLGEARFSELAADADVIFHLGAHMNFVRPYRVLHGPNVRGTQEILRLACAGRPSELHYVSTIDSLIAERVPEQPIPVDAGKDDGYVLTKKTAERLVLQAGERGLPVGIYRPWQITSDSRTGAVNPNDQLALCLTGILLTGIAPSDNPLPLRILPVEMVAGALADMIGRLDPERPIHNFYNTRTTPIEVVSRVVAECGYQVRVIPYRQWRVEVIRRTANQVAGLSALLANDVSAVTLPSIVETANLRARLGYAPAWPSDDHRWVRTTIEYLVRSGVVDAPAGGLNSWPGKTGKVSA